MNAIEQGVDTADIFKLPVRENIARAKYIENDKMDQIVAIKDEIDRQIKELQAAVTA